MITYCKSLQEGLLDLRDRAFLLTLVDTGLQISEACSLKRGDIDWQHQLAFMIASGNKRTVARASQNALYRH